MAEVNPEDEGSGPEAEQPQLGVYSGVPTMPAQSDVVLFHLAYAWL